MFIHHLPRDRILELLGALTRRSRPWGRQALAADTAPSPALQCPRPSQTSVFLTATRWEVLEVTKKAVASPRILSLAKPRVRKDLE